MITQLYCPYCQEFEQKKIDESDHHKFRCLRCGNNYTLQESNQALLKNGIIK